MTVLKEERTWTIVDPLQHDAFETSMGVLQPNEAGYITTKNEALVQEIKQREPWALATEHEPMVGGRAVRGQSMIQVCKTWESADSGGVSPHPRNVNSTLWVDLGNGRWVYRNKG